MERSNIPPAIFAVILFGVGIAGLLFPYKIRAAFLRLIGNKHEQFPSQTIPSIRFGGPTGILMAIFVVWAILSGR